MGDFKVKAMNYTTVEDSIEVNENGNIVKVYRKFNIFEKKIEIYYYKKKNNVISEVDRKEFKI